MFVPWILRPENRTDQKALDFLERVWDQMVREKRDELFFYDGAVVNVLEFKNFLFDSQNLVVFILDAEKNTPVLLSVLNALDEGIAQGHFCPLGAYKRGIGECLISFWKSLGLRVIWGKTPASYDRVLKLIKLLGFTTIGSIPGLCWELKEDKWTPAAISYLELNKES